MPRIPQRRLTLSIAVIIAWFGLIAEGAHALYTDAATLAGNTISAGSVDLVVSNSQSASSTSYADSRTGFAFSLNPGESDQQYFLLKNTSTSNVTFDIDVMAGNSVGKAILADAVQVEFTPVDGTGAAVGTPVSRSLGFYLANHVAMGSSIDAGKYQRFKVKVTMKDSFSAPGESLGYDLIFTGTQHVSA